MLVNDKEFTPDTIKYALENGISDYFVKPINANDLLIRIEYLILFKKTHHIKNQSKKIKYKKTKYKIPTTKRIFDIVFSGLALLILSPILLLTALIIWIDSGFKGNVFYKSKRVGTGYKIFDFYKFRSMKIGADKELKDLKTLNQYQETEPFEIDFDKECPRCKKLGHPCSTILIIGDKKICENFYLAQKKQNANSTFIKIMNDPRITRFGKFIRKTSIDELPQLINVLKGDMSIVGNRPLPLYEAELLTSDNWTERFLAPAGITGLWQISKRGKADMSEEERKNLDNEYAKKNSFWFDIKIILKTIPALFQKENV
ncbi:MAG: sugar transferase [Bacteroidales bacterium]|nr:sugar transferase [Bacteroidales bacterium]